MTFCADHQKGCYCGRLSPPNKSMKIAVFLKCMEKNLVNGLDSYIRVTNSRKQS